MKRAKKGLGVVFLTFILLVVLSSNTSAATTYVSLYENEKNKYSNAVGLTKNATWSTQNYSHSDHDVYSNRHYSEPGKGWAQRQSTLVLKGQTLTGTNNFTVSSNWRIELNPWGWDYTGSRADGWIRDN
ncbi:hypothetical protein ACOI1C_19165 [Bacillus sp. DJP31]|uniref:hypothetical protein n=1 Tax=Bacillus sp. DJP31 TaxID=3409789 RepID=UPI003BB6E3ED